MQHLNGLVKPTSGTVLVDGMDLWAKGTDLRAVRKKVGLVFQYPEYQLFEETVLKDIAFGPRNLGLSEAQAQERAREAAQAVNLPEEVLERSPFDLSGGQKRRVAIAGVLAMHPRTPDPGRARRGAGPLRAAGNACPAQGAPRPGHDVGDGVPFHDRREPAVQAGAGDEPGRLVMDGAPGEVFGRRRS